MLSAPWRPEKRRKGAMLVKTAIIHRLGSRDWKSGPNIALQLVQIHR